MLPKSLVALALLSALLISGCKGEESGASTPSSTPTVASSQGDSSGNGASPNETMPGAPASASAASTGKATVVKVDVIPVNQALPKDNKTIPHFAAQMTWKNDGTTPIGPVFVTADALDPVKGLAVSCAVNGEEMQSGNTSQLVFDAADLVSYVSQFTTLRPGDVILTGTPGGVGMGMTPPRFLADGDVLTTTVEGIGTLTNRIRVAAASA